MTMPLTARIALEVATHEGVIRQTYKDSVGVLTWSVGLTSATGHDVARYLGNPQPLEHCLAVYAWALNNYAEAVRAEFAGHDLTEPQFGGALSFHWNTGSIRSATWPDLWKQDRIAEARASFESWRKPAEVGPRRDAEARLFFDGEWSGDGFIPEYTRLTRKKTPVWSSRVNVDARAAFASIFEGEAPIPAEAPVPRLSDAERLERIAAVMALP